MSVLEGQNGWLEVVLAEKDLLATTSRNRVPISTVLRLLWPRPVSQGHAGELGQGWPSGSRLEVALYKVRHLYRGLDQEEDLPVWYLPWCVSQLSLHQLHVVVH